MFGSVLVANRGEIAVRVIATLRKFGIRSVVVCSIPDRHSLAVRVADASILLEGYSASETYLDIEAVVDAALSAGCEAIHPGYGFLSERAEFARRCVEAGLVFIGPHPDVLAALGDKSEARRLAVANGVPVVPGWDGDDDADTLAREAERAGFPVMLKARGGGGGRGMRVVERPEDLPEAIESARREAQAAFGDPGLLLERLVLSAHHVEVQVLADEHGNVVHLGERDCSVQRRHQKLIEETPSPVVDARLREALTSSAIRLARAVGYTNAGTFEFLVGEPAEGVRPFYFLEVNPRLQVEHPVTEMVTGLDLVELQLRIAAGEQLPFHQHDVAFRGHAFEFRLNAEDPWSESRPAAGRIEELEAHLDRFDSGYAAGDSVPSQYDSLVAKVIVHGEDRERTLERARRQLAALAVRGPATNLPLHRAVVASGDFSRGAATVGWLEEALPGLLAAVTAPTDAWLACAAAISAATKGTGPFQGPGWLGAGSGSLWLSNGVRERRIRLRRLAPGIGEASLDDESACFRLEPADAGLDVVLREGRAGFHVEATDRGICVRPVGGGSTWTFRVVPPPPLPRRTRGEAGAIAAVVAPLAGTIAAVRVADGDEVEPGQLLLVLEAMKMEHRITAPSAGRIASVRVKERDVVREGDVVLELA